MKKTILFLLALLTPVALFAAAPTLPNAVGFDMSSITKPIEFSSSINLLLSLGMISLIPFFLISTTSFLRIVIVLAMLRQAVGTNQSPPNPVIISLALFMTIFVMSPVWKNVYDTAVVPYNNGVYTQTEAMTEGMKPFREFMLKFTREKDLALFIEFSRIPNIATPDEIPTFVLIPSFVLSELKTAFQIGFLLYVPFVIIDLVVSNILLSLGMFMLSPVMISAPFKLLLFVITDGWNLLTRGLLMSFQ